MNEEEYVYESPDMQESRPLPFNVSQTYSRIYMYIQYVVV